MTVLGAYLNKCYKTSTLNFHTFSVVPSMIGRILKCPVPLAAKVDTLLCYDSKLRS
jgi:hypothetical protein